MSGDFDRIFDRILDECIDRINSGQSPEECLRLYPEFAQELGPLLSAMSELQSQIFPIPSQVARRKGKERLLGTMAELAQKRQDVRPPLLERLFGQPRIWAPVAVALVLALVGYGLWAAFTPSSAPVAYAGILEVRVTDAPTHEVSAINVTVGDIKVHKAGDEAGWLNVIEEDRSFDLLQLRGVEEVLGSSEVDAGHYTQIRLDVKDVTVTVDGEPQSAVLPSGELKIIGSFDVEEDETTVLTLDFDADKSVVITGSGKVIFKPVVKLMVAKKTGATGISTPIQNVSFSEELFNFSN